MPLRILVVEDYAPFRRFACMALQQRAFQIYEAADGWRPFKGRKNCSRI